MGDFKTCVLWSKRESIATKREWWHTQIKKLVVGGGDISQVHVKNTEPHVYRKALISLTHSLAFHNFVDYKLNHMDNHSPKPHKCYVTMPYYPYHFVSHFSS
ncbi:unnamed protein product [Sphenostylis stenocarpa]|uniref:Uncharacterized protein n=1 Tax=Sphenostylis stenocarpa TaxID=92480 RepID=A0AA86VGY1_9FABA|nr:unnamed protein product [Sphenostylis stenocarpa]